MLNRDDLKAACLSHKGAFEDFPFGDEVAVFKVQGKVFALLPVVASPMTISLKCDPHEAELLRERYAAIVLGWHLNKKHWNTVTIDGTVPYDEVMSMIEDSYILVVKNLTRKLREELQKL